MTEKYLDKKNGSCEPTLGTVQWSRSWMSCLLSCPKKIFLVLIQTTKSYFTRVKERDVGTIGQEILVPKQYEYWYFTIEDTKSWNANSSSGY